MRSSEFTIAIVAAVCFSAGAVCSAWTRAGQPTPPSLQPDVAPPLAEKPAAPGQKKTECMPFGLAHDFGKMEFGTTSKHTVCIVNTAGVPLRLASVRASSANHLKAKIAKEVIQPREEGKVEIIIDARFFVGVKVAQVWLEVEYDGKSTVVLLQIRAESVKEG